MVLSDLARNEEFREAIFKKEYFNVMGFQKKISLLAGSSKAVHRTSSFSWDRRRKKELCAFSTP